MRELEELIRLDIERMKILSIIRSLELPDCFVAAGFLRNLVWDYKHSIKTNLNDIDIVFYDKSDSRNQKSIQVTDHLNREHPGFNWEVKNQAFMHIKNGDAPYKNTLEAMSYWPEKETAIGAALKSNDNISITNAFGLESLFNGKVTYNNKRSIDIFLQRVKTKKWLQTWPQLQLVI